MTCIAGTPNEPLPWVRYKDGQGTDMFGRWCDRTEERTTPRACGSCPAYRGKNQWGAEMTGLAADDQPYALRLSEAREYDTALEATLIDDDFAPLARFLDRLRGAPSPWSLRYSGTTDWDDHWAAYMRSYRAANQGLDQRKNRQRPSRAAYQRARRARLRQASVDFVRETVTNETP